MDDLQGFVLGSGRPNPPPAAEMEKARRELERERAAKADRELAMAKLVLAARRLPQGKSPYNPIQRQGVGSYERDTISGLPASNDAAKNWLEKPADLPPAKGILETPGGWNPLKGGKPPSMAGLKEGFGLWGEEKTKQYDVVEYKPGRFSVRPKGSSDPWTVVNPEGFDMGDLTDWIPAVAAYGAGPANTIPKAVGSAMGANLGLEGVASMYGVDKTPGEVAESTIVSGAAAPVAKVAGDALGSVTGSLYKGIVGKILQKGGKALQVPEQKLEEFSGRAAIEANKKARRQLNIDQADVRLRGNEMASAKKAALRKETEPPIQATKDARAKMVEEREKWLASLAAEDDRVASEAATSARPQAPLPKPALAPERSIDDAIQQAIADAPADFGDKVFISNLHGKVQGEFPGLTLDQFKQKMVELQRGGKVDLSRTDLVEAFDTNPALRKAMEDSETSYLNAKWHWARKPKAEAPVSKEAPNLSIIEAKPPAVDAPYSNATFEALDRGTLNPATGISAEVLRAWPEIQVPMEKRFPGTVKKIGSYAMGERRVDHGILRRKNPKAYDENLQGWAADVAGILEKDPVYKAAMKSADSDAALRRARLLQASPQDVEAVEQVFKAVAREKVKPTSLTKAIRAYQATLPATAKAQARKTEGMSAARDDKARLDISIADIRRLILDNRRAGEALPEPVNFPVVGRLAGTASVFGKVMERAGERILGTNPAALAAKARNAPAHVKGKIRRLIEAMGRGATAEAAQEIKRAMNDPSFRAWAEQEFGSEK